MPFLTLSQQSFAFPNPVGFDVNHVMEFLIKLLSLTNNYYLSLRIHATVGARRTFVIHLTEIPMITSRESNEARVCLATELELSNFVPSGNRISQF